MDEKEMKGALWPDNNAQILYKGKFQVNGETKYATMIKTKTQNGNEIVELCTSAGIVYQNREEEKQNPKTPDVGGTISINGNLYKLGGWNNIASNGTEYLGLSLEKKEQPF
jgi:hypothetical protein